MKNILVINGHPDNESFNFALSDAYIKGAQTKDASVSKININELNFNPNLQFGYRKRTELETDLLDAIEKIKKADHIVWIFPMWWYGYPAIMKGFIDRTFLPGIAFETIEGKLSLKKLFTGKTARLIITADTPKWYNIIFMKSPAENQLKKGTLQLCGISPVKTTYIAPIKNSDPAFREKWIGKIFTLGKDLKIN